MQTTKSEIFISPEIILNALMFDSITFTPILILAIAALSFISVSILCEFAMLQDLNILLSP